MKSRSDLRCRRHDGTVRPRSARNWRGTSSAGSAATSATSSARRSARTPSTPRHRRVRRAARQGAHRDQSGQPPFRRVQADVRGGATERRPLRRAVGNGGEPWRKHDPPGRVPGEAARRDCTLTHAKIEEVIGARLPPSAKRHRVWWGNEADGAHVQCRSWLGSGWEVDAGCQPDRGVVRFVRRKLPPVPNG